MTGGAPEAAAAFPNLRHIRLLVEAVRGRSLSAAAAQVHVTQPAASQAMARLARLYGAELLTRHGNGIRPTDAGEIVGRRGYRALGFIREIAARAAARSQLPRAAVIDRVERHATLAQLRAIRAFAETGSFAAAAAALGQREPSVQRAARDFERVCGLALFGGTQRALQLGTDGRFAAARAALALTELQKAHEELRELAGRYDGQLVIGTLPLIRTEILPVAVVALMRTHPEARVEIADGAYEDLLHRLAIGRIDMILGALRPARRQMPLRQERLFTDTLSVVGRRGHPLAGHGTPARQALAAWPWVLSRRDSPNRAVFDRMLGPDALPAGGRGFVETGSLVAVRGLLAKSDYLALLSPRQVSYELRAGLLVEIAGPVPGSERDIGITALPGHQPTALERAFLDALRHAACAGPG